MSGLRGDTVISPLDQQSLEKLGNAIRRTEGWQEGKTTRQKKKWTSIPAGHRRLPSAGVDGVLSPDDCLTYGKPVALTGLVSLVWGRGPPGYGEDPKHDDKGQYAVMMLDHHICVTGGDPDGPDADAFDIERVQLVPKNFHKFKRGFLGK